MSLAGAGRAGCYAALEVKFREFSSGQKISICPLLSVLSQFLESKKLKTLNSEVAGMIK